jgi:hypothetical protein
MLLQMLMAQKAAQSQKGGQAGQVAQGGPSLDSQMVQKTNDRVNQIVGSTLGFS